MKLLDLLEMSLPTQKWIKVKGKNLAEYRKEIFDLIQTAYKEIGGHAKYKSPNDISDKDAQFWELVDVDGDGEPDAVNVVKKKPAGMKSVGMGHDGSKPAKRVAVKHKIDTLKKPGWYAEMSGRILDIMLSSGVPPVKDKDLVQSVLGKSRPIEWLGDGTYYRKIGGKKHKKMMVGKPKAK